MNYTRTFLDHNFFEGEIIPLNKKEFHHEINVLRKKVGSAQKCRRAPDWLEKHTPGPFGVILTIFSMGRTHTKCVRVSERARPGDLEPTQAAGSAWML